MSATLRVAPAPPADPWLTLREACAETQISRYTLMDAIAAGRLRAARITPRGPYRIRRSWLDAFLEHAATGGPWPAPPARR